jgi:uncharacterized protein with gpF-like domain
MKINLPQLVARDGARRRNLVLRPIQPTQAQADSLAALYLRVVLAWRSGVDRILAAYEKTLVEMQLDSADDIRAAFDEIAEEVRRIVLLLTPDLREWALRTERVQRGKWVRNILSATQIDLSTVLSAADVAETVEQVIEWNVSLIRDISDEQRRRISNSVFAGIQQRKPAREVAKEIREITGMARARSIRVASDQTVKMGERLNDARRNQAGINHWKWRHSGKLHFRPEHKARDGKVYSDMPGDKKYPQAPEDRPGQLPFCGCTSQAWLVFDD